MASPSRAATRGGNRTASTPWGLGLRGWADVGLRAVREAMADNIVVLSAGCAFFSVLSIFPALTALVSVYGLIADASDVSRHAGMIQSVVPPQVYSIIRTQIESVASQPGSSLSWQLALSLAFALWAAAAGTRALFASLNIVYEQTEERNFFRLNSWVVGFTLAGILALVLAMGAIVYIPALFAMVGLSSQAELLVRLARWPILGALVVVGLAAVYRYGPCRRSARWSWVSPGALLAAFIAVIASAGFSVYVENFNKFNETYGSIGAAIVLLLWFYLTFLAILLGGELNAELEHQMIRDTTVGPQKPLGARSATMADEVAGMDPQDIAGGGIVRPPAPPD